MNQTVIDTSRNKESSGASKKQILMAIIASTAGFSLDLFDLFLLLYVASSISKLIFPISNPTLSLAATYGAFATSMIVRPLGSAVFGALADKQGRKKALFIAMVGSGLLTTVMGIVPTYQQIGGWAAVVFLALRLLQGLFIGGVTASTHTIGTETVPASWRGWVSGVIVGGGGGLGAMLASGVFYLASKAFPGPAFDVWGWRAMFFTGLLSAAFALYIFKHLNESPFFIEMQKKKENAAAAPKAPLKELFSSKYIKIVMLNLILVIGISSMYYLTTGYLPTFLGIINKVPKTETGVIMFWGSFIAFLAPIALGQFSEMYGRRKAFILTAIIGAILFGFVGYNQLSGIKDIKTITIYAFILAGFGNAGCAAVLIFLNERFPTAIRASGTAVCWNVGYAIGGLMPMIVSAVSPQVSDIPSRLTVFLFSAAALVLIGAIATPETKGQFD